MKLQYCCSPRHHANKRRKLSLQPESRLLLYLQFLHLSVYLTEGQPEALHATTLVVRPADPVSVVLLRAVRDTPHFGKNTLTQLEPHREANDTKTCYAFSPTVSVHAKTGGRVGHVAQCAFRAARWVL